MGCRGEVLLLLLLKFGSASGEIRSGGALAWHRSRALHFDVCVEG